MLLLANGCALATRRQHAAQSASYSDIGVTLLQCFGDVVGVSAHKLQLEPGKCTDQFAQMRDQQVHADRSRERDAEGSHLSRFQR